MKWNILLFLITLTTSSFCLVAQEEPYKQIYLFRLAGGKALLQPNKPQKLNTPSVELNIFPVNKSDSVISLQEQGAFQMNVTLLNTSSSNLQFDTFFNKVPNVWHEENSYWNISFEIFEKDKDGNEIVAICRRPDIDWTIDPEGSETPIFKLKPNESYSSIINIFQFYGIAKKGTYRIYGIYKRGAFCKKSKDFVEVVLN